MENIPPWTLSRQALVVGQSFTGLVPQATPNNDPDIYVGEEPLGR